MKECILVVSVCKYSFHEFEFVKPIEDILQKQELKFFKRHYQKIKPGDLKKCSKVIICGTSLRDFEYLGNLHKFEWIKKLNKPVFGICAGMQIILSVLSDYDLRFYKDEEIGFTNVYFEKPILGFEQNQRVYSLHQLNIKSVNKTFEVLARSNEGIQAIKHKTKEIYGVLFHPEVRQKDFILNFCNL